MNLLLFIVVHSLLRVWYRSMRFALDGTVLVTCTNMKAVQVWNLQNLSLKGDDPFELRSAQGKVKTLDFEFYDG